MRVSKLRTVAKAIKKVKGVSSFAGVIPGSKIVKKGENLVTKTVLGIQDAVAANALNTGIAAAKGMGETTVATIPECRRSK